jgi:SPASM domain peptide maturase of grasp-with-spasm system
MENHNAVLSDHLVFVLFACCVPVRGARRSVICDLQRQSFRFIPNGLYEILTQHKGKTTPKIKEAYDHEFDEEIDEYFSCLIEEELGFWCDEPGNFLDLNLSWQRPERITNAIIDVDSLSTHDYQRLFSELDDLACKALELRFFQTSSLDDLKKILGFTESGRLRSIELVVGWSEELTPEAFENLAIQHPRVQSIVVHSAPASLQRSLKFGGILIYRREAIDSPSCCGQIHPGYFSINIDTFTEAQQHNTCLNRKISVDARGEIKNCPSLIKSFGNIREVSLHSALARRDFSKLWSINKDQIEICKDCEFRYICTDCRAYLTNPENLYSKPAKCTYDPYTAKWD